MTEARRRLAARFRAAGLEMPLLDARLLVEGAVGLRDPAGDLPLSRAAVDALADYARRRLAGEPVWRILGEREFWGLTFKLSPATLEPRPDTETIVEAALDQLRERRAEALSILDLGTGTGCLLVALLSELPAAHGLGVDVSEEACRIADGNARANGVGPRARFRQGDWANGIEERFDLIVSNPPYIPAGEIALLAREVREHDPLRALDGGADGLDPYRVFACDLPHLLKPGGIAIFEIGAGQAQDVAALMRERGFRFCGSRKDLGGHERALIFAR